MAEEDIDFENEVIDEQEMGAEDFKGTNYLKIPDVGNTLTFTVEKVVNNQQTKGKGSDGASFNIGLTDKHGKTKRYDIHTEQGVFTINSWEVYFKLFHQSTGLLIAYAKAHNNSFKGAKVSITRNFNGNHKSMKVDDLAKILGTSVEDAKAHQQKVKDAIKEKRLYTVSVA
jgi:hypothetical protein